LVAARESVVTPSGLEGVEITDGEPNENTQEAADSLVDARGSSGE
jgi:hypothetical protein